MVQIFVYFVYLAGHPKLKSTKFWTFKYFKSLTTFDLLYTGSSRRMALYRHFTKTLTKLPNPNGDLWASVSPAAIKEANEAVKSAICHSKRIEPVASLSFAKKFLANYGSPNVLENVVPSDRCFHRERCHFRMCDLWALGRWLSQIHGCDQWARTCACLYAHARV